MSNAIQIENLSYSYLSDFGLKRLEAVRDLSLEIIEGESFGFLGHNGAGKTTTIKCILNLIKPTSGQVKIFGRPSSDLKARALLGYLPEQPYFYDYLSIYELVEMYARLARVESHLVKQRVLGALERVKLSERLNSRLRTLSKGLTQRVALAQAIVAQPKLLVLDEPFSGLDPIGRQEFKKILNELRREGVTIFLCTHILSDAEFLCDRVSIMAQGKLKGVFDVRSARQLSSGEYELSLRNFESSKEQLSSLAIRFELLKDTRDSYLKLFFSEYAKAEQALKLALERGCIVHSFELAHGSLEELFTRLVKSEEAT